MVGTSRRSRKSPGVLFALHGRERQPFAEGPNMIGQTCGHCRRPFLPVSLAVTLTQGSHRPTEVVAVHREIGNRLMDLPVL